MSTGFWVYVNVPNDKALIHLADCAVCNNGIGMTKSKRPENGRWLGPMERESAIRTAKAERKVTTRWCGHCASRWVHPLRRPHGHVSGPAGRDPATACTAVVAHPP